MGNLYTCGLRLVLVMVSVLLVCYTLRPAVYWHLKISSTSGQISCPCVCNCHSSPESDLSFPLGAGLINGTIIDCGNNDPELKEEMEKDIVTLLAEEVRLQKMVANESLEHTKSLIVSARKASLQYQSEAEKCNAGMEICEEARERAMKELMEERRLTELWQNRALEFGWKDV